MSARVLALGTSAGGGDWPPMIGAALALAEAGHEIIGLGDVRLAEATAGTGLPIECVPQELDLSPRMSAWEAERSSNPSAPAPVVPWVRDVAPLALRLATSWRPDLLLCSDFTAGLAFRVRRETGVPVCLVHATFYQGPGARRRFEDDFAPTSMGAQGFGAILQAADLVLIATDAQFDPPPDAPRSHHHWVGTLIWEPTQPTPSWLDEPGHPWAVITLSTVRQANELDLARAAIAALAKFPLRVLLTLADAEARDEIAATAPNVRIESFVPHSTVLRQSALCVAHAGHGIVAKALHFGVPMVLVPWDRDQPGVAARAEALGVAVVVARSALTPDRLADAVRTVLEAPSYATTACQHGARIRAADSADLVRRRVEEFVASRPRTLA